MGPVLALNEDAVALRGGCGRVPARDVDVEAEKPRSFLVTVFLTLVDSGRVLVGAEGLRVVAESPALSARVRRTLVAAGSGTARVSDLSVPCVMGQGDLQLEGLCFALAMGGGMPLRAFMLALWSSARARGGDDI